VLGMLILAAGIIWSGFYLRNRQNNTVAVAPAPIQNVAPTTPAANNLTAPIPTANVEPAPTKVETAVQPRTILQPPNTVYFQNKKENLGDAATKNFLGFSLYYPQNWTLKKAKTNFLDVSDTDEKGLPIEQFLVSYYDSQGTFDADRKEFPKLLNKSNNDLKKALQGNYKLVSQGEIKIQNNRLNAFEVKFESAGTAANGEKVTLWGRRLWIPAERAGAKNGYVITMLATSLSPDIKSVEEVGVKGDLSTVLETFEPSPNL
ncbi:MAG: hypothetical protein M3T96_00585, partial [Acidobacteriota bacterium]|nr:hypothetical protein [Acidobacteriota bacterium]